MNRTVTPSAMKALEQRWMRSTHVPAALLMEHAAQGLVDALSAMLPGRGRVLFLCGSGGNGGDGYASARLWQARGGEALIWELSAAPADAAGMNRLLALSSGVPIRTLTEAPDTLPAVDAVVDALFGTGLCRPLSGLPLALVKLVNAAALPVLAADLPSGLDGLTGHVWGDAVHADRTVTFHRVKPGLLLQQGPEYTGQVTVQSILIPREDGVPEGMLMLTPTDLPLLMPRRPVTAHKGTFGSAVLLVGSAGMAGAAAFCASACIRAGAGLTRVVCPSEVMPTVQLLAPGAVCIPLICEHGHPTDATLRQVAALLTEADSAAIGCGMGQAEALRPLLTAAASASCPVVWDADALNLLFAWPDAPSLPANALITPHPGEAARLLHGTTAQITEDAPDALRQLQSRLGCSVLLKGARTLMTDGSDTAINAYGTPALAKGGSGDVLTGLLAGLLCQKPVGLTSLQAMMLACMLHSLAGLRAAQRFGEYSLTPERLLDALRMDARDVLL